MTAETGKKDKIAAIAALVKIAYRNIWRNARRTAFCFTAVGLAVFFIVFYSSFMDGMLESMNSVVQVFELGHVRVVSQGFEDDSEFMPVQYPVANGRPWRELAQELKQIEGVGSVFPRIRTMATLQGSVKKHGLLWGINIEEEIARNHLNNSRRNDGLLEGRFPAADANECAIGHIFARQTGLKIGDRIPMKTVSAQFSDRPWSPVITGIFNFDYALFDSDVILVDHERLQRLLVMDGGAQQLVIFMNESVAASALSDSASARIAFEAQKLLGDDDVVTSWAESYWVAIMRSSQPIYTVLFMVFLIVASFLIVNTVVMIIHERIKEIGMMGCLGMTRREIVAVFFFESFFLAALGALAGVIVGGILVYVLSHFPISFGDLYGDQFNEMPIANTIFLKFDAANLAQAWFMGVVVASLFTLVPSLKSAFVEPVEALRR